MKQPPSNLLLLISFGGKKSLFVSSASIDITELGYNVLSETSGWLTDAVVLGSF